MTQALYGPPRVGGDILTFCSKCKMELAHVVVSMLDGIPSKVQCKTCRGTHKYRRSGGGGSQARRSTPRSPRVTVRVAEIWEQKLSQHSPDDVIPYNVKEALKKGQVVQHIQFGLGLVEELRSPTKALVLFRSGEKVLVHGLKK